MDLCCYCSAGRDEVVLVRIEPLAFACDNRENCLVRRAAREPHRCVESMFAVQGRIGHGLRCDRQPGHDGAHVHYCMFETRIYTKVTEAGDAIRWETP